MNKTEKRELKKALIKMGYSQKGRELFWEYIYRQDKGLAWDHRAAYGVGCAAHHDLQKVGLCWREPYFDYEEWQNLR